jgi:hypothetical protein
MGEVVDALATVFLVLAAIVFVLVLPDALDRWLTTRADRRSSSMGAALDEPRPGSTTPRSLGDSPSAPPTSP